MCKKPWRVPLAEPAWFAWQPTCRMPRTWPKDWLSSEVLQCSLAACKPPLRSQTTNKTKSSPHPRQPGLGTPRREGFLIVLRLAKAWQLPRTSLGGIRAMPSISTVQACLQRWAHRRAAAAHGWLGSSPGAGQRLGKGPAAPCVYVPRNSRGVSREQRERQGKRSAPALQGSGMALPFSFSPHLPHFVATLCSETDQVQLTKRH